MLLESRREAINIIVSILIFGSGRNYWNNLFFFTSGTFVACLVEARRWLLWHRRVGVGRGWKDPIVASQKVVCCSPPPSPRIVSDFVEGQQGSFVFCREMTGLCWKWSVQSVCYSACNVHGSVTSVGDLVLWNHPKPVSPHFGDHRMYVERGGRCTVWSLTGCGMQ